MKLKNGVENERKAGILNDAMQRIVRLLTTQSSCKRTLCSHSHTHLNGYNLFL